VRGKEKESSARDGWCGKKGSPRPSLARRDYSAIQISALQNKLQKAGRKTMSTPSTTIITNLKGLSAPTTNTLSTSRTSGMDMSSMLSVVLLKASELKACLTLITNKTDGADPTLTTLNNILASLT
jgi:hypothetical protein